MGQPANAQIKVAVANTAVIFPGLSVANGVLIQGLPTNGGTVYVGGYGVTSSNGFPLAAGQIASAAAFDTNCLYVTGANVGDGVAILGS